MHFHHLSARPLDYQYPYPDFAQVIYVAEATNFRPKARQPDEWVVSIAFRPIAEVQALDLSPVHRVFFQAALKLRGTG